MDKSRSSRVWRPEWSAAARSTVSVVVFLGTWEVVGRAALVPPLFFPPFSTVLIQLARSVADGSLVADLALSLWRAGAGLGLAAIVGTGLGLLMARNRTVNWFFDPLVAVGFPSPKIAFLPIFILWFGIESLSKILLVALASIFPIVIGAYSAARNVNRVLIWSAASLGSKPDATFRHVVLPACYPRVFTTLRVALPVALITTFTAEMVGGGGGMGATLMYSQRFFDSPTVFAYVLVMLAIGLFFESAVVRLQQRLFSWAIES